MYAGGSSVHWYGRAAACVVSLFRGALKPPLPRTGLASLIVGQLCQRVGITGIQITHNLTQNQLGTLSHEFPNYTHRTGTRSDSHDTFIFTYIILAVIRNAFVVFTTIAQFYKYAIMSYASLRNLPTTRSYTYAHIRTLAKPVNDCRFSCGCYRFVLSWQKLAKLLYLSPLQALCSAMLGFWTYGNLDFLWTILLNLLRF